MSATQTLKTVYFVLYHKEPNTPMRVKGELARFTTLEKADNFAIGKPYGNTLARVFEQDVPISTYNKWKEQGKLV